MACDMRLANGQTLQQRAEEVKRAIDALKRRLTAMGPGAIVIGANGAIAFKGWTDAERAGVSDACAYRVLTAEGSSELRMALARAEAMQGRKVNPRAVAAGHHSHDGGKTWHGGH